MYYVKELEIQTSTLKMFHFVTKSKIMISVIDEENSQSYMGYWIYLWVYISSAIARNKYNYTVARVICL